ncbi:TetR/AcrR family transcriptional regulator [Curvibacter sp. APW13]|uniref:TetR/AcrR family transcriptional regulator n=1 Tax=Curvibacter sp. APW13 TaxID=3077236 RepID=UPI0028DD96D0|nr:TetR/AcrR family transcriptional regulator [Curvibacter sp. APW13]MDT8989855.1 TetR/AcrR family transcriptional regulator [Curvibacter sp. APW13]
MRHPEPVATATELAAASAKPVVGRVSHKGQQTKQAIVEAALALSSQVGLEGISIGAVAEATGRSKSGVFAHFGSREELQISVVREYFRQFEQEVFYPAMREPRGLPRLVALYDRWMNVVANEMQFGCIFISGAVDFDDRPGPVRDTLAESVTIWLSAVVRAIAQAKQEGHIQADADVHQIAYEVHGLILAVHYEARFLKKPGSVQRATAGIRHVLQRYAEPKALAQFSLV